MIKSNIDLTENEVFSRPSRNRISSVSFYRAIGAEFPWTIHFHEVKDDYDLPKFQPILTGDKEERELKQLVIQENSGNYCDCCGASLTVIPWNRTWGLCRRCLADMEERQENRGRSKFPWKSETEMRATRGSVSLNW